MNPSRRAMVGGAGLIALAAAAAYGNSFGVPFIFDDSEAIPAAPALQQVWRLGGVLHDPVATSASGRPFLKLTLAVNAAVSGAGVWSYHGLNLLIHIAAGLVLFGLVRRTLQRIGWKGEGEAALGIALLWTLHPLQTESVTYVIQRAESLMGLFYLLTLYCFARGLDRPAWLPLSFLCCLLGMATKEVMVTAPVMVLMYDRTFFAGSFRAAWRQRRRFYGALAATWLLLAFLLIQTGGNRGGTIGWAVGIPWWQYALTQFQAVAHYLWLSVWPHPLVLDYGAAWARGPADVLPYVPLVVALVGGTAYALWRHPRMGFLGFWFLAILAPSSSIIPGIRQTLAEHRMYLPLAAVLVAIVLAGQRLAARLAGRRGYFLAGIGALALSAAAGAATWRRNRDYRSPLAIWSDTVARRPANPYARYNLGVALAGAGRESEAVAQYRAALQLQPGLAEGHETLAVALADGGQVREAMAEYGRALQLEPANPDFEFNLANALAQTGDLPAAIGHFQRALSLRPNFPEACLNLGNALLQSGRPEEAARQYRTALRLRPAYADAQNNLAVALRAGASP
jgi:tetratricopeptide (TPR) repeat protein